MKRTRKKWLATPEAHAKLSAAAKKRMADRKATLTDSAKQGWITRRLKAAA
jgi:hypothetical protein